MTNTPMNALEIFGRDTFPVHRDELDDALKMPVDERLRWYLGSSIECLVKPDEADEMLIDERWWPWLAEVPEVVHGAIHEAARTRSAVFFTVTVAPPDVDGKQP